MFKYESLTGAHIGASSEKVPSYMRKMIRFRSFCTCEKNHTGIFSKFIHSVVSNDSVSGQEGSDETARMRRLI